MTTHDDATRFHAFFLKMLALTNNEHHAIQLTTGYMQAVLMAERLDHIATVDSEPHGPRLID